MPKLCVFAGTTEGREIAEFLAEQSADVTVCVATEYGETLLPQGEGLRISARTLPREEMAELFRRERFDLVIDATHPYAKRITESIAATCAGTDTEYLRLLRPDTAAPENAVFVEDAAGAAEYLDRVDGNILLTTGSRELQAFASVRDFASRLYARVLPMEDSLRACREAGLPPAHILAMQGPFSRELNAAMLRSIGAAYLVTKASGSAGGFEEKIAAAAETGAVPVIIGRPPQREGLSAAETVELLCRRFGFSAKPEVAVVGLGPGSRAALTGEAREALSRAGCLVGAARMIEAAAAPGQAAHAAIAPEDIRDYILAHPEYRSFAVVMSGDTGFFSGTKKLLPLLAGCRVTVLPGLSSLSCLCARLGTSYEDVLPVTLHGRSEPILLPLAQGRRVFALVGGENGMGKLCRALTENGMGAARVSVGEHHFQAAFAALRHACPHREAVFFSLFDTDANEAFVFKAGVLVVVAGRGQAYVMGIAVERPVVAELHTSEGFPAHEVLRKLEGAVLYLLGIEAAVGAEIDVFEEKAVHGGLNGSAGFVGLESQVVGSGRSA